ncbi:uncharacterized protein LOC110861449 [Folsomia candida]|uniref:uncharacterized protein LOC110861449 n=1 Tax=Folsomia candida TaxID=158441 RepID=UPI001604EAE2|nr:uncharacterized protein LOC110861449 [Folsomia candida]
MEGVDTGLAISSSVVLTICILGLVGNTYLRRRICVKKHIRRKHLCQKHFCQGAFVSAHTCRKHKCLEHCCRGALSFCDFFLLVLSVIRTFSNLPLYKIDYDNPWISYPIFIWDFICTGGTKYYTVAISLERCFAICFPIAAHRYMTERRARWLAVGVFLFTLLVTLVSYLYRFHWDATSFHVFVAVVLHFAPFLAVLILNFCIYAGVL